MRRAKVTCALALLGAACSAEPAAHPGSAGMDAGLPPEDAGSPILDADAGPPPSPCALPSGDPGDLSATGTEVGDTVRNLRLLNACGDRVALWDLAGEYHILFLTAAW
jgi:hypothetical protein